MLFYTAYLLLITDFIKSNKRANSFAKIAWQLSVSKLPAINLVCMTVVGRLRSVEFSATDQ